MPKKVYWKKIHMMQFFKVFPCFPPLLRNEWFLKFIHFLFAIFRYRQSNSRHVKNILLLPVLKKSSSSMSPKEKIEKHLQTPLRGPTCCKLLNLRKQIFNTDDEILTNYLSLSSVLWHFIDEFAVLFVGFTSAWFIDVDKLWTNSGWNQSIANILYFLFKVST